MLGGSLALTAQPPDALPETAARPRVPFKESLAFAFCFFFLFCHREQWRNQNWFHFILFYFILNLFSETDDRETDDAALQGTTTTSFVVPKVALSQQQSAPKGDGIGAHEVW